jgi:GTPase SAR1 family protein
MDLSMSSLISMLFTYLIPIIALIIGIAGIFGIDYLKLFYYRLKIKNSIAIFGRRNVGKSTLINILQGKPAPQEHDPTFKKQRIGKVEIELKASENFYFISRDLYDVGGEWWDEWADVMKDQDPNGIIYIVDNENDSAELEDFKHFLEIYDNLFTRGKVSKRHLKAILILINKVDIWGKDPSKIPEINEKYERAYSTLINDFKQKFGTDIRIRWTSVRELEYRVRTYEILIEFAKVLGDLGVK